MRTRLWPGPHKRESNLSVDTPVRARPVKASRAAIRVLLVDDHEMIVEGLSRVLDAEKDIEVVGAVGSGAETPAAVDQHRPDVVVMDYQLPDVDGAATTRELLTSHPDTRVIMLTGSTDDRVLRKAIEAGCSGYIIKGDAVRELAGAIRAAHVGESVISPPMLARLLPRLSAGSKAKSVSELTKREMEVVNLLANGLTNIEIAEQLIVSLNTVRNHVQNIITKLEAHSKLEAVSIAVRRGIISYPSGSDQ